jgi:hypothetical protein
MSRKCSSTRTQTVVTGLMFLASGLALWAGARGWYSPRDAWAWWPLGFLFPAVHRLTAPAPQRSLFAAALWLTAAAALILANLGHLQLRARDLIPLALVVFGVRLLYRARQGEERTR